MRVALVLLLAVAPVTGRAIDFSHPNSAEVCGDCHRAIYAGWKSSAHAHSMDSRLFQDALKLAEGNLGAKARAVCLPCHSPIAVRTGDLSLKNQISWEGITCDYCHSIRSIAQRGPNLQTTVLFSKVKSGPWKGVTSPAHGAVYSKIYTSSLLCASCHDYRNRNGFELLATYSEWKDSPAARQGKQCQDCHMYRVKGAVVDPRVKKTASAEINLHEMPGSHSVAQLNRAVQARLSVSREGDRMNITVDLVNRTQAHCIPTGSPLRQMILVLTVDPFRGPSHEERRVYRRLVTSADGEVLKTEDMAFLKGARVKEDTRLTPSEHRTEKFSVPVPAGSPASVEAALWYYYSPLARTEAARKKKFLSLSRFIR